MSCEFCQKVRGTLGVTRIQQWQADRINRRNRRIGLQWKAKQSKVPTTGEAR